MTIYAVGSTSNPGEGSAAPSATSTDVTCADGGPSRQRSIISATSSGGPENSGFDRAVAPIAHPAGQAKLAGDPLGPIAVAHALHAAGDANAHGPHVAAGHADLRQ